MMSQDHCQNFGQSITISDIVIRSKSSAGAHKERSKKYKNNLGTLKSKSSAELNTSIIIKKHFFFNNGTTDFPYLIKLNMSKTTQSFTSSTEM